MGEYDFIAEQYELYGEDYVNGLLDAGYTPYYVADQGWRWLLKSDKSVQRVR